MVAHTGSRIGSRTSSQVKSEEFEVAESTGGRLTRVEDKLDEMAGRLTATLETLLNQVITVR